LNSLPVLPPRSLRETVQKKRVIMVSNKIIDFKNPTLAKKLQSIEDRRDTSFSNFDILINKVFAVIF